MSDSIFGELKASMEQAVEIAEGTRQPAKVTRFEIADVKKIRTEKLHVTQKELAAAMDVSVDTVKSWEQKRRNPTGLASKVLSLLGENPELFPKLTAH